MLQLTDQDTEIIRRAPVGSVHRLAALFRVSPRHIKRIRSGTCGLPLQTGLGARPHLLLTLNALEKWRIRQEAVTAAKYRHALARIEQDQPASVSLTREEELALMPGVEPGSLGVFQGALALKPRTTSTAPPAPLTVRAPAKSTRRLGCLVHRLEGVV